MSITVVFFASLREDLGTDRLTVSVPGDSRLSDLIGTLAESHGEHWRACLTAENIRVAVNQELVTGDVPVAAQDEVAFFPPVTGG